MQSKNPFSPPESRIVDDSDDIGLSLLPVAAIVISLIYSLWFVIALAGLARAVNDGEFTLIYLLSAVVAAILILFGAISLYRRSSRSRVVYVIALAFSVAAFLQWINLIKLAPLITLLCPVVAAFGAVASILHFRLMAKVAS